MTEQMDIEEYEQIMMDLENANRDFNQLSERSSSGDWPHSSVQYQEKIAPTKGLGKIDEDSINQIVEKGTAAILLDQSSEGMTKHAHATTNETISETVTQQQYQSDIESSSNNQQIVSCTTRDPRVRAKQTPIQSIPFANEDLLSATNYPPSFPVHPCQQFSYPINVPSLYLVPPYSAYNMYLGYLPTDPWLQYSYGSFMSPQYHVAPHSVAHLPQINPRPPFPQHDDVYQVSTSVCYKSNKSPITYGEYRQRQSAVSSTSIKGSNAAVTKTSSINISKSRFDNLYQSGNFATPIPSESSSKSDSGQTFKIPKKEPNAAWKSNEIHTSGNLIWNPEIEDEQTNVKVVKEINAPNRKSTLKGKKMKKQSSTTSNDVITGSTSVLSDNKSTINVETDAENQEGKSKDDVLVIRANETPLIGRQSIAIESLSGTDEPPRKRTLTCLTKECFIVLKQLDPAVLGSLSTGCPKKGEKGRRLRNQVEDEYVQKHATNKRKQSALQTPIVKNNNPEWHSLNKSMKCLLCEKSTGVSLVSHYVNVHRDNEVFPSRFTPKIAKFLRNTSKVHKSKRICVKTQYRFKQRCYFCNKYKSLTKGLWLIHTSVHTGDYRYKCADCPRKFSIPSPLHACKSRRNIVKVPIPKFHGVNVFGFLCDICNYVRLDERAIEKHLRCEHEGNVQNRYKQIILLSFPEKQKKNELKVTEDQELSSSTDIDQKLEITGRTMGKCSTRVVKSKESEKDFPTSTSGIHNNSTSTEEFLDGSDNLSYPSDDDSAEKEYFVESDHSSYSLEDDTEYRRMMQIFFDS